jgi:hypothetical protein
MERCSYQKGKKLWRKRLANRCSRRHTTPSYLRLINSHCRQNIPSPHSLCTPPTYVFYQSSRRHRHCTAWISSQLFAGSRYLIRPHGHQARVSFVPRILFLLVSAGGYPNLSFWQPCTTRLLLDPLSGIGGNWRLSEYLVHRWAHGSSPL